MQRGLLTGITIGVAMVIFTLQNEVKVPLKLLWMKFPDVPVAVIFLTSFLLGVGITSVFSFIDKQKLKNRIKKLQSMSNNGEVASDLPVQEIKEAKKEDDGITLHGDPGYKFFDD